jgi:restriction endonuclease S subunit
MQEQSRIADCLMALDAELTALQARIETLMKHKEGLAQKLFCKLDEVRG